jgi:hypothetical protein
VHGGGGGRRWRLGGTRVAAVEGGGGGRRWQLEAKRAAADWEARAAARVCEREWSGVREWTGEVWE